MLCALFQDKSVHTVASLLWESVKSGRNILVENWSPTGVRLGEHTLFQSGECVLKKKKNVNFFYYAHPLKLATVQLSYS